MESAVTLMAGLLMMAALIGLLLAGGFCMEVLPELWKKARRNRR